MIQMVIWLFPTQGGHPCADSISDTKNTFFFCKLKEEFFNVLICHVSCVMCHVSCVICHVPRVTCHITPVICHLALVPCHEHQQVHTFPLLTPPLCTVGWGRKKSFLFSQY